MLVRPLENKDYEILKQWWSFWRFPAPPIEMLPYNEGFEGVMVTDDSGKPMAAGFIYFTVSKICWIEFIVSNPEVKDKEIRKRMLNGVIQELTRWAEMEGCKWVFTSLKNQNLMSRFEDCGFEKGSTNATEMMKLI